MDSAIQHFHETVMRFCAFAEELVISEDRLEEWMALVLQLYERALRLPDTQPGEIGYGRGEMTVLPLKMEVRDL